MLGANTILQNTNNIPQNKMHPITRATRRNTSVAHILEETYSDELDGVAKSNYTLTPGTLSQYPGLRWKSLLSDNYSI